MVHRHFFNQGEVFASYGRLGFEDPLHDLCRLFHKLFLIHQWSQICPIIDTLIHGSLLLSIPLRAVFTQLCGFLLFPQVLVRSVVRRSALPLDKPSEYLYDFFRYVIAAFNIECDVLPGDPQGRRFGWTTAHSFDHILAGEFPNFHRRTRDPHQSISAA